MDRDLEKIKRIISQNAPFEVSDYGKLIRSQIGISLAKSFEQDVSDDLINLLSAIEMIHNASLLHDDVLDDESIRRNADSMNKKEGNKKAVLYGDIILSSAMKFVVNLSSDEITKIILSAISNMCQGELLQSSQVGTIPDMDSYLKKCELKTGSLFQALVKSVCCILNQPDISDFGLNFGIAFQIKNDMDNVLTSGSDSRNGIYTAPFIYSGGGDVSVLAIEKTKGLIDNYRSKCLKELSFIKDGLHKEELIGVLQCLI